jgi:hypothetical protein
MVRTHLTTSAVIGKSPRDQRWETTVDAMTATNPTEDGGKNGSGSSGLRDVTELGRFVREHLTAAAVMVELAPPLPTTMRALEARRYLDRNDFDLALVDDDARVPAPPDTPVRLVNESGKTVGKTSASNAERMAAALEPRNGPLKILPA